MTAHNHLRFAQSDSTTGEVLLVQIGVLGLI